MRNKNVSEKSKEWKGIVRKTGERAERGIIIKTKSGEKRKEMRKGTESEEIKEDKKE